MPPSAETCSIMTVQQPKPNSFAEICSRRTIANAVNYETSMVDFFHHNKERTIHARSNSFVENVAPNVAIKANNNRRRTSKRESKQRSIGLNPISVRYDMEMVPRVDKNSKFLARPKSQAPFSSSVLWRPNKRKDWEDCLSELVAVCTSAGLRQFIHRHKGKRGKKPQFVAPLSRDYIRDRIDIDDPMRGVQIRHKTQGWLQGYLLWTNFTTWTHYFTWDSTHPLAGLAKCEHPKDADGSLSKELQNLPRTGSPQDSGVIFESVAEIALVGGLGCGELLLKMALEEIVAEKKYNYVILQATSGSRTFYERYGFKRVGAICRYGEQGKLPNLETPVQGYRHWTHANESQKSLDMHGGPSYMMVLKLADYKDRIPNLLKALEKYTVTERPAIVATPMSPTPKAWKKIKRTCSIGTNGVAAPPLPSLTSSRKRVFSESSTTTTMASIQPKYTKRPRTVSKDDTPKRVTPASSPVFGPTVARTNADLLTPPPSTSSTVAAGRPLRAPRQYPSSWLSGPPPVATSNTAPTTTTTSTRKQRKPRGSNSSTSKLVSPLTPKKTKIVPVKLLPNSSPSQKQVVPFDGIRSIDKTTLCKQKVKSYPRDRAHFYNKVVGLNKKQSQSQYYFVLHYDEPKQELILCPMAIKGILSGRRQGRPRYQCVLLDDSQNWKKVHTQDCRPVEAFMVMKTPIVAQEAWDILGDA